MPSQQRRLQPAVVPRKFPSICRQPATADRIKLRRPTSHKHGGSRSNGVVSRMGVGEGRARDLRSSVYDWCHTMDGSPVSGNHPLKIVSMCPVSAMGMLIMDTCHPSSPTPHKKHPIFGSEIDGNPLRKLFRVNYMPFFPCLAPTTLLFPLSRSPKTFDAIASMIAPTSARFH